MAQLLRFDDKVAIVTGAGGGGRTWLGSRRVSCRKERSTAYSVLATPMYNVYICQPFGPRG
jgi:hypothetical protein